jgi:hypothetical protein
MLNRDLLMNLLCKQIQDKRVTDLLKNTLKEDWCRTEYALNRKVLVQIRRAAVWFWNHAR